MNKEETAQYLAKHGITRLATTHPDTPRNWVLEYLDSYDKKRLKTMSVTDFKNHQTKFIKKNFKKH